MAGLSTLVHGTAIALAVDPDGPLIGVLIEGDSGAGKSDLAVRVIEACPWRRSRLVADDSVLIGRKGDHVMAHCPDTIAGRMELRGVGIIPMQSLHEIRLRFVTRLVTEAPRLPEPATTTLPGTDGLILPLLSLVPFELSAPAKLRYGVRSLLGGHS